MARMKFRVYIDGRQTAAFAHDLAAQHYARQLSSVQSGHTTEVSDAGGIIGQYVDGKPTPEFSFLTEAEGK